MPAAMTTLADLPQVVLQRDDYRPAGVWGVLVTPTGRSLQTIENADTLIAPGSYLLERSWYYRGDYECFEVIAPPRTRLLIHAANYASELEGCIAPGMERGFKDGDIPAVWRSRHAHGLWMQDMDGIDRAVIHIRAGDRFLNRLAED